jgi:hypothetical protein
VPSDRFLSRLSMAMPDPLLRASGKLNVPVYRLYGARASRDIAVFALEPR